ncbi:hypothetical protein BDD12DRAFT_823794 [Trichophaea hybrida]|nr:hypothetical protein BDD12DRAFT_823794 [Trichophaea hybrida]
MLIISQPNITTTTSTILPSSRSPTVAVFSSISIYPVSLTYTATSSEIRRVNFPEPTTTAFFSPPSIPSDTSCCTHSSCSSLKQSSLPEPHPADSPIGSRYGTWGRSVGNLSQIIEVDSPQPEELKGGGRVFDDSMTRLVSLDIAGVSPFLVFLLAMPFVGVATHTGCVAAMGHGVKQAIGSVRIAGGQRVVFPQKRRCGGKENKVEEEEGRVEVPVYGVEYTAYALEVDSVEVGRRLRRKDKGKKRAMG